MTSEGMAQRGMRSPRSTGLPATTRRLAKALATSGRSANQASATSGGGTEMLLPINRCANIMRAEFRDVAVSYVSQAGSNHGRYWTMSLARPL